MDITTFRWILIVMGVLIIAGIFLFGNPERKPRRRASRKRRKPRSERRPRREPTLAGETSPGEDDPDDADEDDEPQGELRMETDPPARPQPEPQSLPGPPPDKAVVLYVQARDNHTIPGVDLLDAALKSGMEFGALDIFHRVQEGHEQPIFSMANLTKPGQFDKQAWNTLETRGVTLFMTLPGPIGALDAWDAMLATGRRIAELLHADLLDESRSTFTRQREGQIRAELRDYERSQKPEA